MDDKLNNVQKTEKTLEEQFQSVLEIENISEERLNSDILNLTASPEDIKSWWFSRDPLLETLSSKMPNNNSGILSFFKQKRDLFSRAALSLFMHTTLQDGEVGVATNWVYRVLEKNGLDISEDIDENFVTLSNLGMSEYRSKVKSGLTLNRNELEQLITSAQMANSALSMFKDVDVSNTALYKNLFEMGVMALEIVSSYVSLKEPENSSQEKLEELDEIRMTALRACLMQNALIENYRSARTDAGTAAREKEIRDTSLSFLIQDFRSLFATTNDNTSSTIWKRLKSNNIRGSLHEAIWYLDFIMLKHMYPEKYADVHIVPANSYADQPKIGKPEQRRAYDMYIRRGTTKIDKQFVQLKSAPVLSRKAGSVKKYHPSIQVIEEQNFTDINPSRLLGKLNAYKKVVENGFTDSDKSQVDKYILPSVKHYLENQT